jgi:hypothetical protein
VSAAPVPQVVVMTREELEATLTVLVSKLASTAEREVLTVEQAAEVLDVCTKHLMQKLVPERDCPVHYMSPKEPRFRRSEILEWLSKQPKEQKNVGRS